MFPWAVVPMSFGSSPPDPASSQAWPRSGGKKSHHLQWLCKTPVAEPPAWQNLLPPHKNSVLGGLQVTRRSSGDSTEYVSVISRVSLTAFSHHTRVAARICPGILCHRCMACTAVGRPWSSIWWRMRLTSKAAGVSPEPREPLQRHLQLGPLFCDRRHAQEGVPQATSTRCDIAASPPQGQNRPSILASPWTIPYPWSRYHSFEAKPPKTSHVLSTTSTLRRHTQGVAECRHSPLLVVVVLLLVGTGPCPCMHQNPHSHIVLDHAWHIVGNVTVELQLQPVTQGHRLLGFRLGWIDDGLHLPHFDDRNGLASKLPVNPTPQGVTGVHGRIPFHVVSGSKVPGELWKGSFRQRLIDIALLTSHLGRLLDRHQTGFIGRLETGLSHPIVLQGSNCLAKLCYWLLPTRTIHHIDIVLQGLHSMLGQELRAPGFLDVGGFKAWAQTSIRLENVDPGSSRHVGPKPCKGGGHDHTLTLPIQRRPPMSVTEHELARLLPTWKKSQTPGKTKHACRQNYIFTTPTRPTPTKAAVIHCFSIHHRSINATTSNAPLGPRRWLWGVWPDIAGKSRPSKLRQSLLQHAPGLVQMENLCTKVLVVLREAQPSRYGAFSPVAATSCCRWRILPAPHQPALQPPPKHLKLKKTSHPLRRQMTWSPPFQAPLEPSQSLQ